MGRLIDIQFQVILSFSVKSGQVVEKQQYQIKKKRKSYKRDEKAIFSCIHCVQLFDVS